MVNKAILIGRVGSKAEINKSKSGTSVLNISLATNEKYNGKVETEWHRIVIWGKTAEFAAEHVVVGALVYVEGKNKTREWTDRSGTKKYITEIYCNDLKVVNWGDKPKQEDTAAETKEEPQGNFFDATSPSLTEEDIPF